MKIIEKKCPNCGGNLDFKVGERDVKCESCRRKYAIEYGDTDFSQLTEKAVEALKAADVSLRPVRRFMVLIVASFFVIAAVAIMISIITMHNRREEFRKSAEQSQQEFEERTQEMLDSIKR